MLGERGVHVTAIRSSAQIGRTGPRSLCKQFLLSRAKVFARILFATLAKQEIKGIIFTSAF